MRRSYTFKHSLLATLTIMSFAALQSCEKSEPAKSPAAKADKMSTSPLGKQPANSSQTKPEPQAAATQPAQVEQARSGAMAVQKACELYQNNKNAYPAGISTLRREALLSPRGELDPWGQRYNITVTTKDGDQTGINVCSSGPDKVAGTPDDVCSKAKK
jgi:hypothetical protein